jgi:hypothetical protein
MLKQLNHTGYPKLIGRLSQSGGLLRFEYGTYSPSVPNVVELPPVTRKQHRPDLRLEGKSIRTQVLTEIQGRDGSVGHVTPVSTLLRLSKSV